jgi:GNAT superfamily N-acetyltransferase
MADRPQMRRYRRQDDEAATVRFLLSKLAPAKREEAFRERVVRWRWQYYDNPHNPEPEPIIFVAEAEGAIVGLLCPLAVTLRTKAGLVSASWGNDWLVEPRYRGTGLGWAMMEARVKSFPVALSSWALSARAYEVIAKLGLAPVPGFTRAWIVLSRWRCGRLLAAGRRYRKLLELLRLPPELRRLKKQVRPGIEVVTELPQDSGDLWERVSTNYGFAIDRSLKYLEWRYRGHPTQKYRFVTARHEGALIGLAVVRLTADRPPLGSICDLLADPGDSALVSSLISAALDDLRSLGACAAIADFPPKLAGAFLSVGKPVLTEELQILISEGGRAYADAGIFDAASWYLSRADSDIDFADRLVI